MEGREHILETEQCFCKLWANIRAKNRNTKEINKFSQKDYEGDYREGLQWIEDGGFKDI